MRSLCLLHEFPIFARFPVRDIINAEIGACEFFCVGRKCDNPQRGESQQSRAIKRIEPNEHGTSDSDEDVSGLVTKFNYVKLS